MGFKIVSVSPHEQVPSFANTTLIMPTLSIGNIGQLAVDLIINTLSMKRVAYIDEPSVLPFIGNDVYAKQDTNRGVLSINIEVFFSEKHELTIIQQRAPVIQGKSNIFTTNLIEWIRENHFKRVLLLSSADSSHRIDTQITDNTQLRYTAISTKNLDKILLERLTSLQFKELENGTQSHDQMEIEVSQSLSKMQIGQQPEVSIADPTLFLRRAGITHRFFRICKNICNNMNALALIIFCSEGENIPEAVTIANATNALLQLLPVTNNNLVWIPPKSWEFIRGSAYDAALYM